jgi:lipoate-protein ligase A
VESVIRLLPYSTRDGAANMAADETLVHSAASGVASLRFYGWTTPTVSLGYFQPYSAYQTDNRLSLLPCVRRPTGGATLVHHLELTYALAIPPGPLQSGESWLVRMHRIIVAALVQLGCERVALVECSSKHGDILCFQQHTIGDVLCAGHKVAGSAQRKYRQALMQHGSIQLAQSEHTPSLSGIRELTGVTRKHEDVAKAILDSFTTHTGCTVEDAAWTVAEREMTASLIDDRYATKAWNERR